VVYELFFTTLPQQAFTASDVVELYLHRGAFEPVLADEDQEIDPDRWCSHTACGQEACEKALPLLSILPAQRFAPSDPTNHIEGEQAILGER
jgi:hypothetical protein